jgi:glycosyltransferase involved in cell wall biosynthesis
MSAAPLVTIGLPVYNSARYLEESLESLLAQTFRDYVLIISDNASTDETAEICQRYVERDSRIRYHRNAVNIGLSGNYNRVFELSDTKYFKWATADDRWAEHMVEDAVRILESDPSVALCYPNAIIMNREGEEIRRYDDQLHLMQDDPLERFVNVMTRIRLVHQHLGVLRSDVIRRTRMFAKHTSADVGFVAEMSLHGKIYRHPQFHIHRRFHEDSSSWATSDDVHQARRYYAAGVKHVSFNRLRFHFRFYQALFDAPVPMARKLECARFLLKRMYWDSTLKSELRRELRTMFGLRRTAQ